MLGPHGTLRGQVPKVSSAFLRGQPDRNFAPAQIQAFQARFATSATNASQITSHLALPTPGMAVTACTRKFSGGKKFMTTNYVELPESVEQALREVSRIKSVVSEAVEDGVKSAVKAIKQGRTAAGDAIVDARHTVRQRPFQAVGVVFGAGVLVGGLLAWLGTRRD
jgi:ElaB/YqjD/DUF883 family membrane-anchored ribosome-binding protein